MFYTKSCRKFWKKNFVFCKMRNFNNNCFRHDFIKFESQVVCGACFWCDWQEFQKLAYFVRTFDAVAGLTHLIWQIRAHIFAPAKSNHPSWYIFAAKPIAAGRAVGAGSLFTTNQKSNIANPPSASFVAQRAFLSSQQKRTTGKVWRPSEDISHAGNRSGLPEHANMMRKLPFNICRLASLHIGYKQVKSITRIFLIGNRFHI